MSNEDITPELLMRSIVMAHAEVRRGQWDTALEVLEKLEADASYYFEQQRQATI